MIDADLTRKLADLFRDTGRAHHQAYLATDGEDPEWPLWYADYLQARLEELLKESLTKSEIVYLLVAASKEQEQRAPKADWTAFYAKFFLDRARK